MTPQREIKIGQLYWVAGKGPMRAQSVFPGGSIRFHDASGFNYWAGSGQVGAESSEDEYARFLRDYLVKCGPWKVPKELRESHWAPADTFGGVFGQWCADLMGSRGRLPDDVGEDLFVDVGQLSQRGLHDYPIRQFIEDVDHDNAAG